MEEIDSLAKAMIQAQENSLYAGATIATMLGISTSYYSDIRRGNRTPSPELLERFALLLDIPLEPLLWFWLKQHMTPDHSERLARWLREP